MNRLRPHAFVIAAVAFALIALVAFVLLGRAHGPAKVYSDSDPAFNRAFWEAEISRLGPKSAYAEFAEKNAQAPTPRQHFAAHVMGSVLGERFGAPGIAYCDSTFGFGCYHGFFAQVISTGGTPLIAKLDAACVQAYGKGGTGCQHGIGHGILEYVGYENVNAALDLCGQTTQIAPLLGCASGVFMENDFRLAGAAEGKAPATRIIDPAHPYAPCDTVPAKYQGACYVDLGQWFFLQGMSVEKIGSLCSALPAEARTHCFLGMGSIQVPMGNYDPVHSLAECQTYAGSDQLACRAGAWWGFAQVPEHRTQAESLCAYADAAQANACKTLGDFSGGLITAAMVHAPGS